MVQVTKPADFSTADFTVAAAASGGVTIKTGLGSSVNAALVAAIAAIPNAGDVIRGLVQLATSGNHPQATNDVDATTPAYVAAAINAALATLPAEKFLALSVHSYNATTNTLTLTMSDGSTVPVDMTGLIADAVATITTGQVPVNGHDGTLLGYLLPV